MVSAGRRILGRGSAKSRSPRWPPTLLVVAFGIIVALPLAALEPGQVAPNTATGNPAPADGAGSSPAAEAPPAPPLSGVGSVVESVRHRVSPAPGGALEASDDLYRMQFYDGGFAMFLRETPGAAGPVRRSRGPALSTAFEPAAGLRLAVNTVTVGSQVMPIQGSRWSPKNNVAEREILPGVTERLTARDRHVEWDVVLQSPPRASGDLTVAARLHSGGAPQRSHMTEGGASVPSWRIPLGGGRSVQVGELVVLDAFGKELYRSLPDVSSGHISLSVPAAILTGAHYPVTLDPVLSPEYPVSDPVLGLSHDWQFRPVVAWNGTSFLVVWQDTRGMAHDIYATRVTSTGAVLDPTGIPISRARFGQGEPAVAADGDGFLVVWADSRDGYFSQVYGARVTASGTVLDPSAIRIGATAAGSQSPAVAWGDGAYLVSWAQSPSGTGASDILGARVTSAGLVIDTQAIAISTASDDQYEPSVGWDGEQFFVAWTDERFFSLTGREIFGARVASTGAVLDPVGIPVSTGAGDQVNPAVASDGEQFLVAWTGNGAVFGARVRGDGWVVDRLPVAISGSGHGVAATWAGSAFFVVWRDDTGVYGARVNPDGTVLDRPPVSFGSRSDFVSDIALARGDSNLLVVWPDQYKIYGARSTSAATPLDLDPIPLSTAANTQSNPAVAWGAEDVLVVWTDERGSDGDLYAARVGADGSSLDGAGIAVATATGVQLGAVVVWDGTNFLIAWSDYRNGDFDVYAARVGSGGVVLDPGGFQVAAGPGDQTIAGAAHDGTNALVVWTAHGTGAGTLEDIYGARVSPSGEILDRSGIAISTAPARQRYPAVVWDGANFVVAWEDSRSYAQTENDIFGARVSPAGVVLDPAGFPIAIAAGTQWGVAGASNGETSLFTWTDGRHWAPGFGVYGARVARTGAVLDPGGITISPGADDKREPTVGWDGANFLVAWQDSRADPDPPEYGKTGSQWDVFAARITASGTVLDTSGVAVAETEDEETAPAITAGPGRSAAIAYTRMASEAPYGASRVFLRFFGPVRPPPGITRVVADFDGNDRTDVSVFRPSSGTWFVQNGSFAAVNYGTSDDIPVPADYDGDQRADVAVFRPSNGLWFERLTGGGEHVEAYGTSGDVPVPADYDGDGKSDVAVFRPSSGTWFVRQSLTGEGLAVNYGTSGDVPVPADYDGDGTDDVAVYRPTSGTWFVRQSLTGTEVTSNYGTVGDVPVPADYDGDGKADLAVFRPSNGVWFMLNSGSGAGNAFSYGTSTDIPVPGHYDADAKADVAVFRPENGAWFVHQSSNGEGAVSGWGIASDVPLPLPYAIRRASY